MEYLIVLAGSLAALFFLILVFNKGKRTEHWLLSLLFFLIIISCYYMFQLYQSGGTFYAPVFSELNYAIPLLYGLLLWMYTRSLIVSGFRLKPIDAVHLVPFVFFLSYLLIPVLRQEDSEATRALGYPLIKLIINPIYIFLTLKMLEDYRRGLFDRYSFIDRMHHYWLTWIAYGALLLWIVACIGNVFNWYNGYDTSMLGDYFLIGFLAILMFILAYVGFNRTEIFQAVEQRMPMIDVLMVESKTDDRQMEYQAIYTKLLSAMRSEQPHLDPQLSLNGLAAITGISSSKLSMVINQVAGKNFYDFINEYRVQAVKERLQRGELNHYSMLGIATECGFNSKASFNRIFKKQTQQTPTAYVNSLRSHEEH